MEQRNNNERLTDRAFIRLITTSVLGIILCLVCLCSTTWAWFSDSAASSGSKIVPASQCLLDVSVKKEGDTFKLEGIDEGVTLEAGVTYTVTLELPRDSASGYCIITTDARDYYTEYIERHDNDEPKTIEFTLTVAKSREVKFIKCWGTYHSRESDVQNNGQLHIQ